MRGKKVPSREKESPAEPDSFTQYRKLVSEKVEFCFKELSKGTEDPKARDTAMEAVLLGVIEDLKELKSAANMEADHKVKKIHRCFPQRIKTLRHHLRYLIEVLRQGGRWVVYVILCLDLIRVYVGRMTLYDGVKKDPSAAKIDNQESMVMEEMLQSDDLKQLVQCAVDSMDDSPTATFDEYYGDLLLVWDILNEPVATCDCRQCSVRRGFKVRFL